MNPVVQAPFRFVARTGLVTQIRPIMMLYLPSTLGAALAAVVASFMFPTTLALSVPPVTGRRLAASSAS